jgi:hypothetical protein
MTLATSFAATEREFSARKQIHQLETDHHTYKIFLMCEKRINA